jgi:transposase
MYAALDLGQRTIRAVLKRQDGKIVNELNIKRQADSVLKFLNGTNASVVMESGYNYQYLYDLLKSEGYNVKVAHPFMVKAIAYATVKTDKVDARILADLLRTDMIPECYIPEEKIRNLRDLARRRHYFVNTRTMFKNKVHVELSKRWIDYSTDNSSKSDLFTQKGREYLRSLKISGVKDCLDTIDFLDTKIQEMDNEIKILAGNDKYAKHLITIPGISYYAALLISSEIDDINRFPDYEHLSSYAKLVPGTHQSGETQYSKANMKGSQMLNWIMVQCTHTHVRYCNSSVTRHYNKIKSRKGTKIAIIAAARKMMRAIYVMLKEDRSFRPDG